MAKGMSIHVGINTVDPDHYAGWDGALVACEFDANDMAGLAEKQGFEPRTLLTKEATADAITAALEDAASKLATGDILFLSYSGHGGQVPDKNSEEPDRLDETWVCFDRQLVDDELYDLWSRFQPGVRIAVLSDSCHSGSAVRTVRDSLRPEALGGVVDLEVDEAERFMKAMPERYGPKVYEQNQELYDGIQRSVPAGDKAEIGASVLLVSGCQDNQTSADGQRNGLFTQTLLAVLQEGKVRGGYRSMWKKIVGRMPPWQSPNFMTVGRPDRDFERQSPFTV